MKVATFNVHGFVGRDGRYDPRRALELITELELDYCALQEVTLDDRGQLEHRLREATGLHLIDGTLWPRGEGRYGNVLLARQPPAQHRVHEFSFCGRERRGAIEAQFPGQGKGMFSVVVTHLGLSRQERQCQIGEMVERMVSELLQQPIVVMGDMNVWRRTGELAALAALGLSHKPVASFPTWPGPVFALDRILASQPLVITRCWRHVTPLAKSASDHFPVVAEIHWQSV